MEDMKFGVATTLKLTYHNTVVCELLENSRTRLKTGGWYTVTTKRRMNQFAKAPGLPWNEWSAYDRVIT